ncbi:MAG: CHAT domain-containing protein [Bacteroidota bacterium]
MPTIFLSFANDKEHSDRFLEQLGPERTTLQRILTDFNKSGWGLYHSAGSSAPKELLKDMQAYTSTIIIFHFSGHANGTSLSLENGEGGNVALSTASLKTLLSAEPTLKLVFLNACATKGHVETLLAMGIPAVIATEKSVLDTDACVFSEAFYKELVLGKDLKTAFGRAKMVLDTSGQGDRIYRDVMPGPKASGVDKSSWGLYVQNEEVLSWSLKPKSIPNPKVKLYKLLARYIVTQKQIFRYATEAGLPIQDIDWDGSPKDKWNSVVKIASDRVLHGIPKLIQVILNETDKGTDIEKELKKILIEYESFIASKR